MCTADRISRGFHRLGLLYAAIPVLAGIYDAYESARHFEQQRTIDWLTIVINELLPRLGLSLLLAFFVYNLFRAVGLFVVRLDRVSLAAQATLHRDYGKAARTRSMISYSVSDRSLWLSDFNAGLGHVGSGRRIAPATRSRGSGGFCWGLARTRLPLAAPLL